MRYTAEQLARKAGFIVFDAEADEVRVSAEFPMFLFVGPRADRGLVASVAIRRLFERKGLYDEVVVRAFVERNGYQYRAPVAQAVAI